MQKNVDGYKHKVETGYFIEEATKIVEENIYKG